MSSECMWEILGVRVGLIEDPTGGEPHLGVRHPCGPDSGVAFLTIDGDEIDLSHFEEAWAPSWSFALILNVQGFSHLDRAHQQRVLDAMSELMQRSYNNECDWLTKAALEAMRSELVADISLRLSDVIEVGRIIEVYELWSTHEYAAR